MSKRSASESAPTSAPTPKRKRVVMNLDEKMRVLNMLRSGESIAAVGRKFHVNESTIRSIRQKEEEIRKSIWGSSPECAKVTSVVRNEVIEKMEMQLNFWINEVYSETGCVSDSAAIKMKAKQIYEHLTANKTDARPFSASSGWLARFKNRYDLKNTNLNAEAAATNVDDTTDYVKIIQSILERKGYQPEQVFNADATGLFYKQTDIKSFSDQATMLLCANACGDFKCKPLLVYRKQMSGELKGKNLNHLPVIWKSNHKGWITSNIFWDWFNNYFIPSAELYLYKKNLAFKLLLILDNSSAHNKRDLEYAHPNVEVLFLPSHTSSLLQPLEQGVIKTFKSYYIQELYHNTSRHLDLNPGSTIKDFWKTTTICNIIEFVSIAWGKVSQSTINNCWSKIWPKCITNFEEVEEEIKYNMGIIKRLSQRIDAEGLQDEDVADILTQGAVEPKRDDSDSMDNMICNESDEDSDSNHSSKIIHLTISKLEKWTSLFDEVSREILEYDPLMERSLKFKNQLEIAFRPYTELLKEMRWQSRNEAETHFSSSYIREQTSSLEPSTSQWISTIKVEVPDLDDVELP